jgi:cell division septation protein DedD
MKNPTSLLILISVFLVASFPSSAEDGLTPLSDDSEQWIYLIQVGGFDNEAEAKELMSKIYSLKMPVQHHVVKEKWHRLLVGPYPDNKTMFEAEKKLTENGIQSLRMRRKVELKEL